MSSNEDDIEDGGPSETPHGSKKRRVQRACDICRRKKIRCDGVQMPGNRCSNCATYGLRCTYVETAKKRGPSKGYVEALEHKITKMERLLRRLCPDDSVYRSVLHAMEKDNDQDPNSLMNKSSPPQYKDNRDSLLDTVTRSIRNSHLGQTAVGKDEDYGLILSDFRDLAIDPDKQRFFGKSSDAVLIQKAVEAKVGHASFDKSHPVLSNIRPEFWIIPEWEKPTRSLVSTRHFVYPPTDLALELIDNYFRHANLYLPLLHRPSFDERVKENLHLTNLGFASVYLLVCCIGSKYSDDPRVKCDGQESCHSAGWRWFDQTVTPMKTPMAPATLYDVQSYALAVLFLSASGAPQNCWTMIGIGIRVAQDVGAHIKRPRDRSAGEDESWKRAFWVLCVVERLCGATLGRPCAIQEEDFDLDLPEDCDDEYWDNEDPTKNFQQPEGVPSKITAFILLIKLTRILSVSLRTIYAINKSKLSWGYQGDRWQETVVAELDSALNGWVDLVPAHLRWDPHRVDKQLFDQSVTLYCNYYFLRIIVHRPFIPTPDNPSPSSFPSLAICANAARSCSHLADLQRRRTMLSQMNQMPVCTAAIILLLNLWSGRKSGLSTEAVKNDMKDILMCMQGLQSVEKTWQAAGRLWDILHELTRDFPLPESKPSSKKRPRGSNGPQDSEKGKEAVSKENRNIASARRPYSDPAFLQLSHQSSPGPSHHTSPGSNSSVSEPSTDSPSFMYSSSRCENINLPMYGKELGQIPLHGPFTFRAAPQPQVDSQTTPSSASSGSWYPAYTENAGIEQAHYSGFTNSLLHQQPLTGLLEEMRPHGPSDRVINSGTMPMRNAAVPITPQRFLQETVPSNINPMTSHTAYDVQPNPGIPTLPLRQHSQGHRHLENVSAVDPGMGMPGIDMGTINSDVMSMWLNASPTSLMDDWSAYFTPFGQNLQR